MDCLIISYSEADRKRERQQFFYEKSRETSDWSRFLHLNYIQYGNDIALPNHIASIASAISSGGIKADENGMLDYNAISRYSVWKIPLLGGLYLYQFLRKKNLDVRLIQHAQMESDLLEQYLKERPTVIAISTTLILHPLDIYRIIKLCRSRSPDSIIAIGGIGTYNNHLNSPENLQQFIPLQADVIILDSHGADTLYRIIEKTKRRESFESIPNTVTFPNKRPVLSQRLNENFDINSHTMDWNLVDASHITNIAQMRTQFSCPFSCSFCSYPIFQGKVQTMNLDLFEKELIQLKARGVQYIIFIDDTFNVPQGRFREMMKILKKYDMSWYAFIRCQFLTAADAREMKESGCRGVFLGFESADDMILKNMNKRATRDEFMRGMDLIANEEILSYGSFIVGFPGETEKSVKNTFDFIKQSGLDYWNTKVFYYEPSTPITKRKDEFGLSGSGMSWKHNTMTSDYAFSIIESMIREIDKPYIPQHSGELWEIAHFDSLNISRMGIWKLYSTFSRLLSAQLNQSQVNQAAQEEMILGLSSYF